MVNEVRTGMVLEDVELPENREDGTWLVMDGKLEQSITFDEKPDVDDLNMAKSEFGYSKAKVAVNEELNLIVLTPVDVSGFKINK
jgi:hypothetical protein